MIQRGELLVANSNKPYTPYFSLGENEDTWIKLLADENGRFCIGVGKHRYVVGDRTITEICPAKTAELNGKVPLPSCPICQAGIQYPQYSKAFVPTAYMYFFVIDGKHPEVGVQIWSVPYFRGHSFLGIFHTKLKELLSPKGLVLHIKRVRNERGYLDYAIIGEREADLSKRNGFE